MKKIKAVLVISVCITCGCFYLNSCSNSVNENEEEQTLDSETNQDVYSESSSRCILGHNGGTTFNRPSKESSLSNH
ncbi:MAG: hypothetical protein IKP49_02660 [Treponema sp.]|nr:hypothetical protein [Treponema sp.]